MRLLLSKYYKETHFSSACNYNLGKSSRDKIIYSENVRGSKQLNEKKF